MIPRNKEQIASEIYSKLIQAWNNRNAVAFAKLIAVDGNVIGFDGSQLNGRAAIQSELERIFRDHQTPPYITKIEEVRPLESDIVLLRAIAGMTNQGESELNPSLNAVQTMVIVKEVDGWSIALFQTTPAQFHGRPHLVEAMTNELRVANGL